MYCNECFHYHVCEHAVRHKELDMCKQAFPFSEIDFLKQQVAKLTKENNHLKKELDDAQSCIYEVEDHLNRGTSNDWAEEAIMDYYRRHDDHL